MALHVLSRHHLASSVQDLADHVGAGASLDEGGRNRRRAGDDVVRVAVEVELDLVAQRTL
ncbi:MAG TPA: hypothetical protein VFU40_05170 [Gemmatimonadales bacterium]|nr:hypothetical protein [Gemmatimonadales bacterium]